MATIKVQAILGHKSGLPRDNCVNTWHFTGPNTPTDLGLLCTDVLNFYTTVYGGTYAVKDGLANALSTIKAKAYDISGAAPHPPLVETLTANIPNPRGAGADLPSEVAVCLSFQGLPASGVNQARRRGRVYIGSLNEWVNGQVANDSPRPFATFTTVLNSAAADLKVQAAADGYTWVVHSPTGGTNTPVEQTWVDNEFDTQRRRGHRATLRNLITL